MVAHNLEFSLRSITKDMDGPSASEFFPANVSLPSHTTSYSTSLTDIFTWAAFWAFGVSTCEALVLLAFGSKPQSRICNGKNEWACTTGHILSVLPCKETQLSVIKFCPHDCMFTIELS